MTAIVPVSQNTNNQLFCSVKNAERERRGLFGVETNATLPADWKHHEPRKDSGPSRCLCSHTCSHTCTPELNEHINIHRLVEAAFITF